MRIDISIVAKRKFLKGRLKTAVGDSLGVCRDIESTTAKTARGNISSNLSRVVCEGGVYKIGVEM